MVRFGVINLKNTSSSPVQCSGVAHPLYKYGVGVLYAEGLSLGESRFLIDNNIVDKAVQQIEADSCEMMLIKMMELVQVELLNAGIAYIGVKIILKPHIVADEKVAEFSLCSLDDEKYTEEIFSMKIDFS